MKPSGKWFKQATELLKRPEKTLQTVARAYQKADRHKYALATAWDDLTCLFRLVRAYVRKDYTNVPWRSIVLSTVAIVYFVSPIDLIPDAIPIVGFIDDIAVLGWVVAAIKNDLEAFRLWESTSDSASRSA